MQGPWACPGARHQRPKQDELGAASSKEHMDGWTGRQGAPKLAGIWSHLLQGEGRRAEGAYTPWEIPTNLGHPGWRSVPPPQLSIWESWLPVLHVPAQEVSV